MSRRKGSDNFGFRQLKSAKGVELPKTVKGADNVKELSSPLSFDRRFRPALNTKDFSLVSEYDYASLWARWRRGYELSMYTQNAYAGIKYTFKYYVSDTPGVGNYYPGFVYMYPTTRSDSRMYTVSVRPRDAFNFAETGLAVVSATQYDESTYAVVLSGRFGAPISFFAGEVLSNRYAPDKSPKTSNYNNYTVTAVGVDGVPADPSYEQKFNTLFLSFARDRSWSVVNPTTFSVPASGPPGVGDFLTTELRSQCSCPDYLSREAFNLYEYTIKRRYPFTRVQNLDPGIYDAGDVSGTRVTPAIDKPGYVRTFGFIYLNDLFEIPTFSEQSYSDPNLYYYQPKWCKHIYAAMWDLQRQNGNDASVTPWLPQPKDEPLNEWYREHFDKQLKQQSDFLRREKDLVWWQRYSPAVETLGTVLVYPDNYNNISKTLNFGTLVDPTVVTSGSFEFFSPDQFDPSTPSGFVPTNYDGGQYANGIRITPVPSARLNGGIYASGVLVPPAGFPSYINGGTYS